MPIDKKMKPLQTYEKIPYLNNNWNTQTKEWSGVSS